MSAGIAAGQPVDVERVLAERFGFSPADVGQVRAGQLLTRTLPGQGPEIGVFGVVRIADDKERLVRWIRDVEGFRKAAELGVSRKLSSPPAINDFADLALDSKELAALQECQPGKCALRLGDRAIARFRTEVDWTAADAGRRANLLTRQLMLSYAEAYLRGGDGALGAAHNERKPQGGGRGVPGPDPERHATSTGWPVRWRRTSSASRGSSFREASSSCTGPRAAPGPSRRSRSTTW